jgi:hypothetical protein
MTRTVSAFRLQAYVSSFILYKCLSEYKPVFERQPFPPVFVFGNSECRISTREDVKHAFVLTTHISCAFLVFRSGFAAISVLLGYDIL